MDQQTRLIFEELLGSRNGIVWIAAKTPSQLPSAPESLSESPLPSPPHPISVFPELEKEQCRARIKQIELERIAILERLATLENNRRLDN